MFRGKILPSSSGSKSSRRLHGAFPIKLKRATFGILAGVLFKNLCILGCYPVMIAEYLQISRRIFDPEKEGTDIFHNHYQLALQ